MPTEAAPLATAWPASSIIHPMPKEKTHAAIATISTTASIPAAVALATAQAANDVRELPI